jgi:acetylornithine deacetylase/succinyl-diaminopimelate desuccinylase-like protein
MRSQLSLQARRLALATIFAALLAVLALPTAADRKSDAKKGSPESSESLDRISHTLKYLSSDELEGRGVGTAGLDSAADYIANYFSEIGLQTRVFGASPFQRFTVVMTAEMGPDAENRLSLLGPDMKKPSRTVRQDLEIGHQFNTLSLGGTGTASAELVFAGYGITAPKLEYDDFSDVDVDGKVVIILRKEPQQDNPHSVFDGKRSSRHAFFTTKVSNAFQQGAAAVILINDSREPGRQLAGNQRRWKSLVDRLAASRKAYTDIKSPDEQHQRDHRQQISSLAGQIAELGATLDGDGDTLLSFNGAGQASGDRQMPVFFCQRKVIEPVLRQAMGRGIEEIEAAIDETLEPQSMLLPGWSADCQSSVIQRSTEVKNVVGVLEGKGPLANETIILGAHYDHLGRGGQGSLAPWTSDIHNGADDNASGTTGLLEVAYRLAQRKTKSRRRIVFIAFSAEERGLLGSAHYVREPRFPLANTVAMINMDMVGRMAENKLIITGTGTSPVWNPLIDRLNENYKFKVSRQPEGTGPSDHQSFYLKDIPVLHIFTGLHDNYHRPSDDFERVNLADMDRIVDMVYHIVEDLERADERPVFTKADKKRNVTGGGGDRPYFGSIPDFGDTVDGLPLTGVTPGGPAERGGIQAGDVVVMFGKYKIGGIEDFDSALRKFKEGDKVKVTVLREKKKVQLTVTLEAPR